MKLVWSQPSSREDRPKAVMLLAVVCMFLGGAVAGRPGLDEAPRPVRAAVASLIATGGLLFVIGGAAFVVQKSRRSPPPLSLAPSQREEDQR
jgi:hypothetical protein